MTGEKGRAMVCGLMVDKTNSRSRHAKRPALYYDNVFVKVLIVLNGFAPRRIVAARERR